MTYILIKWISEEKWDVYPVKALDNPAISMKLVSDELDKEIAQAGGGHEVEAGRRPFVSMV